MKLNEIDQTVYKMKRWVFELQVGTAIIYQPTRAPTIEEAEECIKEDWPSAKILDVYLEY